MNFLIAVAAMAFVLGVLIVVHEFGHYAVAKLCGVRVEVFSVGFGKRLLGFTRGETDYRISALPFGGYVKMAGENPMDTHTEDPGEFMNHPRWQRFLIAIAGPAMNILLAIGVLTAVFMVRYEHPVWSDQPAQLSTVDKDSPAEKAGLKDGDLIVQANSAQHPTWEDLQIQFMLAVKEPAVLTVLRDGQVFTTALYPQFQSTDEPPFTGLVPKQPIVVTSMETEMPLYKSGVRPGDEILTVDGAHFDSIVKLKAYLAKQAGKPIELNVKHGDTVLRKTLQPVLMNDEAGTQFYGLGFRSNPVESHKLHFADALSRSVEYNKKTSVVVFGLLGKLVKRQASVKQMSGPVGIAKFAGEAARQDGWIPLMTVLAFISLQLGLFNLLPIPILDGGMILFLFIEGILGRDIDQRIKERIYQTAFVFLVIFAAMVIFNDVSKLV